MERAEQHELPQDRLCEAIYRLISCDTFDAVMFRDSIGKPTGYVMLVDDDGWECETVDHGNGHIEMVPVRARKPINPEATRIYRAQCKAETAHRIAGDVAIAWDEDFA
jgi:hypothetical protein